MRVCECVRVCVVIAVAVNGVAGHDDSGGGVMMVLTAVTAMEIVTSNGDRGGKSGGDSDDGGGANIIEGQDHSQALWIKCLQTALWI